MIATIPDFLCPRCARIGEKKLKRTICRTCYNADQAAFMRNRPIKSQEQRGAWDEAVSNKYLIMKLRHYA